MMKCKHRPFGACLTCQERAFKDGYKVGRKDERKKIAAWIERTDDAPQWVADLIRNGEYDTGEDTRKVAHSPQGEGGVAAPSSPAPSGVCEWKHSDKAVTVFGNGHIVSGCKIIFLEGDEDDDGNCPYCGKPVRITNDS